MTTISIFAMVGRTDLRLVAQDRDDRLFLVEIDAEIGAVHDWLMANQERVVVTGSARVLADKGRLAKPRAKPAGPPSLAALDSWTLTTDKGELLSPKLLDEKLWLVSDKLGPLLDEIREERHTVRAVRIFDTQRSRASRYRSNEPHAVGPLLAAWLRADLDIQDVAVVSVLQDEEDFRTKIDSAFQSAVTRIIEAVRETASQQAPEEKAWVADGGGINLLKPVLAAAIELHYAGQFLKCDVPDNEFVARFEPPGLDVADLLRLRHRVAVLVQAADFSGALACASPAKDLSTERPWYDRLRALSAALSSLLDQGDIAKLPKCKKGSKAVEVAAKFDATLDSFFTGPDCWLPAVLTECALSLDELLRAAIWSATFYESALVDFVLKNSCVESMIERKSSRIKVKGQPAQELTQEVRRGKKAFEGCLRYPNKDGSWEIYTSGDHDPIWDTFLKQPAFSNLHLAMRDGGRNSAFEQRNAVIHRCPSRGELQSLRRVFEEKKLWAAKESVHGVETRRGVGAIAAAFGRHGLAAATPLPGKNFLGQPVVKGALQALGVADPSGAFCSIGVNLAELIRSLPVVA